MNVFVKKQQCVYFNEEYEVLLLWIIFSCTFGAFVF